MNLNIDDCGWVGIEVKATPLNRRPRTPTCAPVTENRALPCFPTTPLSPGRDRRAIAVLLNGASNTVEVPIAAPVLSIAEIKTVVERLPGLTIDTPEMYLVSSNSS